MFLNKYNVRLCFVKWKGANRYLLKQINKGTKKIMKNIQYQAK